MADAPEPRRSSLPRLLPGLVFALLLCGGAGAAWSSWPAEGPEPLLHAAFSLLTAALLGLYLLAQRGGRPLLRLLSLLTLLISTMSMDMLLLDGPLPAAALQQARGLGSALIAYILAALLLVLHWLLTRSGRPRRDG
ncbi:MAG: hypothetical protein FJ125_04080 [Deltaproteobacteria bacterium]|nr:hypothetical protein [Deltaproteobacteria bacterium]